MPNEKIARVYAFGCKPPTVGADLVKQQLRLAHLLYNDLIAVERARRDAYRDLCMTHNDELLEVSLMIEALFGEISHERAEANEERVLARSRRGADAKHAEEIKEIESKLEMLWEVRDELIADAKANDPNFASALKALDEKAKIDSKALYKAYCSKGGKGLYWATFNDVKASVDQAKKTTKGPLRFRVGGGFEGVLAVQPQKTYLVGAPIDDDERDEDEDASTDTAGANENKSNVVNGLPVTMLFGNDTRLQVDPVDPKAYDDKTRRGDRRRARRVKARFRVGSTDKKKPIFIEIPVAMHRQMPADGHIKLARLVVKQHGTFLDYSLQFTVVHDGAKPKVLSNHDHNAVGVDLGWRWQAAIRVAYTFDVNGHGGPVHINNDIVGAVEKSASLRAIRDRNMNQLIDDLREVRAKHAKMLPEWFMTETQYIAQWRNPAKLGRLLRLWTTQRFDGDEIAYEALKTWDKQDRHLWNWEFNNRRKAIARRKENFRIWAAEVASKYDVVVIEDFDLSQMARKAKPEEKGAYDDLARGQRIVSAPSMARDALINACASRGTKLIKVPCAKTTTNCHLCGHENQWDKAKYLTHACTGCGKPWDQDQNAAANILKRGLVALKVESAVIQMPRTTRWAKLRALKKAKEGKAA